MSYTGEHDHEALQQLAESTGVDLVFEMGLWVNQTIDPLREGWYLGITDMPERDAVSAIGIRPFDFFVYRGGLVRTGWVTKQVIKDRAIMESLVTAALIRAVHIRGLSEDAVEAIISVFYPEVLAQQREAVAA